MIDATRTTTDLLHGLMDPANRAAWEQFDRRYRPILTAFARKLGLDDAEAADVAQDSLADFARQYPTGAYDRARARLRQWLIGIAKRHIARVRQSRARHGHAAADTALEALPGDDEMTTIWDAERRAVLLHEALTRMREESRASPKTLQAFELVVHQGVPAAAVAETLGMSTHDVYLAKSRCLQRIRAIVAELEAALDGE